MKSRKWIGLAGVVLNHEMLGANDWDLFAGWDGLKASAHLVHVEGHVLGDFAAWQDFAGEERALAAALAHGNHIARLEAQVTIETMLAPTTGFTSGVIRAAATAI